jgi:hypothetical protein
MSLVIQFRSVKNLNDSSNEKKYIKKVVFREVTQTINDTQKNVIFELGSELRSDERIFIEYLTSTIW